MEGEEAAFEKQHPMLSCLARTYMIVEGCVDRTSAWCCCGCPCLRRWESEEEKAWGRGSDRTPLDDAHHLRA